MKHFVYSVATALVISFCLDDAQGKSTCQRGFTLYNNTAKGNTALTHFRLHGGEYYGTIDLYHLYHTDLSLGVEFCNTSIKSTKFSVAGKTRFIDNSAPFTLGDKASATQGAFLHIDGDYVIEAPAYSQANGKGSLLDDMFLQLNILPPLRFTLVDTVSTSDIASDFDEIQLPAFPAASAIFSIRVDTPLHVSSISFDLECTTTTDKTWSYKFVDYKSPFTLAGEDAAGHYKPVPALDTPGLCSLAATATRSGYLKGPKKSTAYLYFEVVA